ncbi:MAG TPA: hypothetical protein VGM36_11955 [Rhizomicrobium sp.]
MWKQVSGLALVGLLAVPALAAEAEKPAKPSDNAPGTSVEMPAIISPINDADGRLAGYAYITCTIVASSPDVAVAIRSKTPFIQDAFVRDVNGLSIALASDPTQVDKDAVAGRFLVDARKVMGGKKVVSLAVTQVQMAALRAGPPSALAQTPPAEAAAATQQAKPAAEPEKTGS